MHSFWTVGRRLFAVLAAYTLLYAALFSPVVLDGKLLAPADGIFVFLPGFLSAREPWDPYMFAGFPGLADPQRMAWYPPALAVACLPQAWNVYVISAYVLASSFTYGYVLTLTGSRLAAAISGTVFGMSGFMMAHLAHTNMIHSAAWLPAMVWCFEKLRRRADARWVAAAAIAVAHCALAGHPQILVYASVLVGAYVLVAGRAAPAGARLYYVAALLAAGLGATASAILLLPLQQLAQGSLRAEVSYATLISYALPARQLPQLIFPYAYGGTLESAYFGLWNPCETTGYAGLLPLLLAGVGAALAPDRRLARFWLAVGLAALLFALGSDGGLSRLAYHAPLWNKFRCPARHFGEFALAVSVLAGLGVASLTALPWVRRARVCRAGTVALVAVVGAAWLAWALTSHPPAAVEGWRLPWRNAAIGLPLSVLAVGLASLWTYAWRPSNPWAGTILVVAVALDMAVCARFADWSWLSVGRSFAACPSSLVKYRERLLVSGQRLTGLHSPPSTPIDAVIPNMNSLWRLPSTCGYHPLILSRMSELLMSNEIGFCSLAILDDKDRALDLLASRYVLAPKLLFEASKPGFQLEAARSLTESARFARAEELDGTIAFENLRARPRAWLVRDVRELTANEILRAVHESCLPDGSPFDPARLALVERPCTLASPAADSPARAVALSFAAGVAEVQTDTRGEAFCVISDIYYPGWRATIDGRATELFQTNYVLMGVVVPPGKHVVRFEYVPMRFYLGAAISATALLIVLGLLVRAWTTAPRPTTTSDAICVKTPARLPDRQ